MGTRVEPTPPTYLPSGEVASGHIPPTYLPPVPPFGTAATCPRLQLFYVYVFLHTMNTTFVHHRFYGGLTHFNSSIDNFCLRRTYPRADATTITSAVARPKPILETRMESYYCWATLGPSDRPHTLGEGRAGSLMTLDGRPDSWGRLVDPKKVAGWRLPRPKVATLESRVCAGFGK